jgi:putative heme iron utilization protein
MTDTAPRPEPRPSQAELGRALLARCKVGVLTTLDTETGHPYASVAEILPTGDGNIVLFISGLAVHTRNLKANPKCGFLTADGLEHAEPLVEARVSLLCHGQPFPATDDDKAAWLTRFPTAAEYIGFSDFGFWRLHTEKVRYIAGFGRMSWISGEEWAGAEPDPLWESATGMIAHMNDDHRHNMVDYARAFGGFPECEDAFMLAIDRFGFDVRATTAGKSRTIRFTFDEPAINARFVRKALVDMAAQARKQLEPLT